MSGSSASPAKRDLLVHVPGRAEARRSDRRDRRRVVDGDGDRVGVRRAVAVGDAQRDERAARRVGVRGVHRRGVVEGPVAVEIPGVGERAAVLGVRGGARVEAHEERARARGGRRPEHRRRRLVRDEVAHAHHAAAVEVGDVEVAVGAALDVHRAHLLGRERARGQERDAVVRVRQARPIRKDRPDAVAGSVAEEERAVVRRREAAGGLEGDAGDRRAARPAGLPEDDLLGVVVGPEGTQPGDVGGNRAGAERAAEVLRAVGRVLAHPLVAGPAEVLDGAEGLVTRLISSQSFQPTSPIQISLVPGRKVKRKGLRRPIATMKSSSATAPPKRGLLGGATACGPLDVEAQDRAVEARRIRRRQKVLAAEGAALGVAAVVGAADTVRRVAAGVHGVPVLAGVRRS